MHINLTTIKCSFLGNRIVQVKRSVERALLQAVLFDVDSSVHLQPQTMVEDTLSSYSRDEN